MTTVAERRVRRLVFDDDAFSRLDELSNQEFYATDRLVSHLDATAHDNISRIIEP